MRSRSSGPSSTRWWRPGNGTGPTSPTMPRARGDLLPRRSFSTVTAAPGDGTSMTENGTIREVEGELGQLRAAAAAPGELPKLRTSVMTHMAWVPERWVQAATETLGGLAGRPP